MRRTALLAAALAAAALVTAPATAQAPAPIKGRIVGLKCAQKGKIGECYLKWAEPMVLVNEDGDFYTIALGTGSGLRPEQLDVAFGQEVEVKGRIVGETIELYALNVLRPVAGKEFFKG